MHINNGLARLKRNIGQLIALGRPRWRNDGLCTCQGRLRVLAIRVSYPKTVFAGGFGDVSNTGRKDALLTG